MPGSRRQPWSHGRLSSSTAHWPKPTKSCRPPLVAFVTARWGRDRLPRWLLRDIHDSRTGQAHPLDRRTDRRYRGACGVRRLHPYALRAAHPRLGIDAACEALRQRQGQLSARAQRVPAFATGDIALGAPRDRRAASLMCRIGLVDKHPQRSIQARRCRRLAAGVQRDNLRRAHPLLRQRRQGIDRDPVAV